MGLLERDPTSPGQSLRGSDSLNDGVAARRTLDGFDSIKELVGCLGGCGACANGGKGCHGHLLEQAVMFLARGRFGGVAEQSFQGFGFEPVESRQDCMIQERIRALCQGQHFLDRSVRRGEGPERQGRL